MVVRITNLTDGPGKRPLEVRVYNKRLRPGSHIDVPAQYIDDKMRRLERAGHISLGQVPPWYADYRAKRKVRNLTAEEIQANIEASKAYKERRQAVKKTTESSSAAASSEKTPKKEPVPNFTASPSEPVAPEPDKKTKDQGQTNPFDLSDMSESEDDNGKESRRRKKRR